MKGTIVICALRDMVVEKFGKAKWENVLEMSGVPGDTVFLPTEDAAEETVREVANNLCRALGTTIAEASDAFGEYWVNSYLPRLNNHFNIIAPTARDFLMMLNEVHGRVVSTMGGVRPPCFKYRWKDANILLVTYESRWNLMPFYVGLVKAVGKYYEEDVIVNMWSSNQMLITFPVKNQEASLEERELEGA